MDNNKINTNEISHSPRTKPKNWKQGGSIGLDNFDFDEKEINEIRSALCLDLELEDDKRYFTSLDNKEDLLFSMFKDLLKKTDVLTKPYREFKRIVVKLWWKFSNYQNSNDVEGKIVYKCNKAMVRYQNLNSLLNCPRPSNIERRLLNILKFSQYKLKYRVKLIEELNTIISDDHATFELLFQIYNQNNNSYKDLDRYKVKDIIEMMKNDRKKVEKIVMKKRISHEEKIIIKKEHSNFPAYKDADRNYEEFINILKNPLNGSNLEIIISNTEQALSYLKKKEKKNCNKGRPNKWALDYLISDLNKIFDEHFKGLAEHESVVILSREDFINIFLNKINLQYSQEKNLRSKIRKNLSKNDETIVN